MIDKMFMRLVLQALGLLLLRSQEMQVTHPVRPLTVELMGRWRTSVAKFTEEL